MEKPPQAELRVRTIVDSTAPHLKDRRYRKTEVLRAGTPAAEKPSIQEKIGQEAAAAAAAAKEAMAVEASEVAEERKRSLRKRFRPLRRGRDRGRGPEEEQERDTNKTGSRKRCRGGLRLVERRTHMTGPTCPGSRNP